MKNGAAGGFVSLNSLSKRTSKRVRALKKTYSELCASGVSSEPLVFFADNFHTILSAAGSKAGDFPEKLIYFNGGFELAEAIISASKEAFPDTDEIILILRGVCASRRIFGCELEYLKFSLIYSLVEKICDRLERRDLSLIRYMTLLSDLSSIDSDRINDVLNPVAIKLSADGAYRKSDPKTRLLYREAIYKTSFKFGLDELKLCDELIEKYAGSDIDVESLAVFKKKRLKEGSAALAAAGLAVFAAIISVSIAFWADIPLAAALLFLPAIEALRPLSDFVLTRNRRAERLMRLSVSSPEVRSAKTAIVLSSVAFDPEDAASLYDRLLRLHCLNPAKNISVCALIDLSPEQVPTVSEDRAIIESLAETITKLNETAEGKFSCFVRKRSFSETQQEYMGRLRKRGALLDLAEYTLCGEGDFYATLGAFGSIVGTEYFCAVDSDTLPLMDSVSELLAIALHPANRAVIKDGRVVRGFGIVAPRIVTRLKDSLRSEFSKSLGGIGSKSSYDEEASNLYMDVFGSGTFCGKGLINVRALKETAPRLNSERILSHDILEGELMKTAYAGDICFTEGFPSSPQSYYRRLDRWIRGDFQNIPEIFSKKYGILSKLKLLDNLRRAAAPISVFLCFFISFLFASASSAIVAASALLMWLLPPILSTAFSALNDRALGRRFYSGLISSASQNLRYILYSVITLPTLAVVSSRAIAAALIRLITKRRLLDWTTSEASDKAEQSPLGFYILPELLSLSLLFSPDYFIRLWGAIFSVAPAVLVFDCEKSESLEPRLKYRDSRELIKQTADMWGFFESAVGRPDNYLPPDNIQLAPVYRTARRTSPTNIGLYLLSVLAACDRKLISRAAAVERIERTVATVERLEKYKGNLYNWYDTETLKICPRPFVSSVDSGNFVCCLVALKEGLKEFEPAQRVTSLIKRLESLIDSTDLSAFYDPVRGLMAIGIDPETGERGRACYDCLMSEARLTSFWAIASRQVPKSHWQRLSRAMLSSGFFGGAASYSGTMFEYFMPEIFLKSPEGSLFAESLKYALGVQQRYAKSLNRPYGISESGFYSFDSALNYRYMAHGVPNTGIRRGLERDYVVSPYSTFISLCYSGGEGVENLRKLKDYGMYGSFGLYEALDFTAPDSEKPQPVRSYMAHHVGMSIVSCDNILSNGIMQRRFMRDLRAKGALELLDERFHLGTAVFENNLIRPKISEPEPRRIETESFDTFDLISPRVKLLCNGELTLAAADNGCCAALYRSKNVYLKTRDPIFRPKGVRCFISDGGEALMFGLPPEGADDLTAEFGEDFAAYYRCTKKLSSGMKISLHSEYPCELRTFALKNETASPLPSSIISYIEPSLQNDAAERAHPAFSKLFLRFERDPRWDIAVASRVGEDKKIYIGVGFIEDIKQTVSFDRGEVLSRPAGLYGLKTGFADIPPSLISEPDPCIFISAQITLPPKSEAELTMFILCADSYDELINRVSEIRRKKPKLCRSPRLDTAAGRVASSLLPDILFETKMPERRKRAIESNRLPLSALWELSISTELPLVSVALNGNNDSQKLSAYLGAYKLLRLCGVDFQLVFAFDDKGRYEREHYSALISAAREAGLEGSVYSSGGILPLDLSRSREGLFELVCTSTCRICEGEIIPPQSEIKPKKFREILPSSPILQKTDYPVACGGFFGESYVINEKPPLPWCHILSNRVFGTLVSEGSLGFTYAFNSQENRLTPWDNDPARDNLGERLILEMGGKLYDVIRGAAAVFSPYKAEYFSKGDGYEAKTAVEVSEKGLCKRITVELISKAEGTLSLYTEPCMGPDRRSCAAIIPKKRENGLLLASYASETAGFMFISCSEPCSVSTNREAFLSGEKSDKIEPSETLAGIVSVRSAGRKRVCFYISYGLSEKAAEAMPGLFVKQTDARENKLEIVTDDRPTDLMMNVWLRYQALHARIYARTGFYQCSGAYGFRDQLQDALGIVDENPSALKTQILRCCCAQFFKGDVLHWWHIMPGRKTRGIRTKISDDALWLPFAACEYVEKTGDFGLLSLETAYCDGLELSDSQTERYGEVFRTARREAVYQHCRRAIDFRAGKTGAHGLMLIGSGDWNDGFGNVGKNGEGESVWLTEFYIIVLNRFSKLAESRGDREYSASLKEYAAALKESVESFGRDPKWYLRGYFDDGSKLGSIKSKECKIDSISQSFAEFAGLGEDGFTKQALESACEALADLKRGVIKLFAPPFSDDSEPNPGYIRNYPEGIRENGGQYTHGAVWLGSACIKAGLINEGEGILAALNPINRSKDGGYLKYKTEPYYLCGDVYSNKNCLGRGGWSIYTGSAAWYLKALREDLCGAKTESGMTTLSPSAPIKARLKEKGRTS